MLLLTMTMQVDADRVGRCEAILRGLKKRREVTSTVPVLVHTANRFPASATLLAPLEWTSSLEHVRFH